MRNESISIGNITTGIYLPIQDNIDTPFIKPEPFLKWAGGKGQLLSKYEKYFPAGFNNYLEPFLGGGAVFFHLYSTGRLLDKRVILIDSNTDIINCYRVVKDNVKSLISRLSSGKYRNEEKIFYEIREQTQHDPVEKAARMIYLNKTCYNGLYRVNQSGKFNVPFGRYKNPLICDTENLLSVSEALKNVELINGDFSECQKYSGKNDFLYFDPPYQPISKTASFTGYTSNSFGKEDQERLARIIRELDENHCKVMLSNSDSPFVRNLYKGFQIKVVKAKRIINCKASKRGEINELVILNY